MVVVGVELEHDSESFDFVAPPVYRTVTASSATLVAGETRQLGFTGGAGSYVLSRKAEAPNATISSAPRKSRRNREIERIAATLGDLARNGFTGRRTQTRNAHGRARVRSKRPAQERTIYVSR